MHSDLHFGPSLPTVLHFQFFLSEIFSFFFQLYQLREKISLKLILKTVSVVLSLIFGSFCWNVAWCLMAIITRSQQSSVFPLSSHLQTEPGQTSSHWFTSSKFPGIIPKLKVKWRQGSTELSSWRAEAGHCNGSGTH